MGYSEDQVPMREVLERLAEGSSSADILVDFPMLNQANIDAVIAKAAADAHKSLSPKGSSVSGLKSPVDTALPFFTYGLFRPGELGYFRLRDKVARATCAKVAGKLLIRDGLPILKLPDTGDWDEVSGYLLFFLDPLAYDSIADLEPEKQYRWVVVTAQTENGSQDANVLIGVSPDKGSVPAEYHPWRFREDAFLGAGIDVAKDIFQQHTSVTKDGKAFLHLQAGYMLLWTVIERYTTVCYSLNATPMKRIRRLATHRVFAQELEQRVNNKRHIQSTLDPSERTLLDPNNAEKAISFYYQLRSNVTHRGKAAHSDFDNLRESYNELLGPVAK